MAEGAHGPADHRLKERERLAGHPEVAVVVSCEAAGRSPPQRCAR